jgi:ubiquinone biosynthesis protein
MKGHVENVTVRRVMVETDRSKTADQAVRWAASLAERYGAELIIVQVVVSHSPAATEYRAAERTRAVAAGRGTRLVRQATRQSTFWWLAT